MRNVRFLNYVLRYFYALYKRFRLWGVTMVKRLQLSDKSIHWSHGSRVDFGTFLEGYNLLGEGARLTSCYVGLGSNVGNTQLVNVKIGRFCSIAPNLNIVFGTHPTERFVSTHPAFYSIHQKNIVSFVNKQKFVESQTTSTGYAVQIGNDVWIGKNVTIKAGVTIGDGAIIGANALVIKDVEPYSINVGVPTRVIKHRFSPEQISFLLDFKWWGKDITWIRRNADLFDDVERFIENLGDEI